MEMTKNNQHSATLDEVKGDICELKGMMDDVLFSVNEFANGTRQEFAKIWQALTGMANKQDLADLESRMASKQDLEDWGSRMATRFVTKSYLDEKLADQTLEISLHLDGRQNKDRSFKEKLVGVISGHSLITPKETNDLKKLI